MNYGTWRKNGSVISNDQTITECHNLKQQNLKVRNIIQLKDSDYIIGLTWFVENIM